jgi:hypothetical protein
MESEISVTEFVEKCLSWIRNGNPKPSEFNFDKLNASAEYREALAGNKEWQDYWRDYRDNTNRRVRLNYLDKNGSPRDE